MYDYNCLMLYFDFPNWNEIMSKIIKDEYLYKGDDSNKYGLEKDPHVTVLYGLLPEITIKDIKERIIIPKPGEVNIKVNGINCFENEEYDVLKFDVTSSDLNMLNKLLKANFPFEFDYPIYHPHITIAYMKKGFGKAFAKHVPPFGEMNLIGNEWVYSMASGEKIKFKK